MFRLGSRNTQSTTNDFASDDQVMDDVHTAENPYCSVLSCWCHTNVEYHGQVQHPVASEKQIDEVYNFFSIPRRRR